MPLSIVSILLAMFIIANGSGEKSLPKITNIQLSTEEGFRIYQHWTTQAFASLLSAFLQEKISSKQLDPVPDQFTDCYFSAQTVPPMAKCIVRLLRHEFAMASGHKKRKAKKNRLNEYGPKEAGKSRIGQFKMKETDEKKRTEMIIRRDIRGEARRDMRIETRKERNKMSNRIFKYGRRMKKRDIPQESNDDDQDEGVYSTKGPTISRGTNYALHDTKRTIGMSPIGGVARLLMAGVLERKNKSEVIPWQKSVERIRQLKEMGRGLKKEERKWRDFVTRRGNTSPKIPKAYEERDRLGTRTTNLDEQIAKLVRDGIRVGMRLAGVNGTEAGEEGGREWRRDQRLKPEEEAEEGYEKRKEGMRSPERLGAGGSKLVELLSPRFLSVTERKAKTKANLLSPSLFTLHNKGLHGLEKELSVPNLMKGAQLTGRDQQEWLNLIMEASGVNEQVESLKNILSTDEGHEQLAEKVEKRYKREFRGLYLTKENVRDMFGRHEERKIDTWEELERSFTVEQHQKLNRTGFATLNAQQLKFFYGPKSPYNDSEALHRLLPIVQNCSSPEELIESDIHRMAQMRSFDIRQNDVVLNPPVFRPTILNPKRASQPIILSPIVFSPTILSPQIMGPAILSPRVFSPPILSPRIMTPLVFSPFLFSSIILTPIIMQPFILSPGLLNSVILSPFIMNPMIMSSQIFHPFVLSPLIMSPGLVNPSSMSPIILSPFVLGPQIFSPKFISGLFLSPYALSPVFMSPVYAYLVVLSPSWLS